MALNETLQTTPPMLLRDYGSLNPTEQRAIRDVTLPAARERVGGLAREEASKTIAAAREAEQTKATELRRMATQGEQQIEQAYGEMREPEPFVAPRRSPEELASTAFGDLIASLMVGGIAKASAISQLQAIKGMQDARAKNDQIAVDNAYRDWEVAEKQKGEFNKRIMDKLKKIQELMPYNKDAAMAEINLLKPELNEGIAQLKLARGDLQGAIDAVEKQQAVIDKRKAEMDKLQFQRQTQMDVARLKTSEKQEKPVKVPTPLEKSLRQGNELLSRLQQLKDTAKPEYFALAPADSLAAARLSAQEMGLSAIANMFGKPVNDDAVLWWKNYNDLISEERKERFGATLTGNEKQSFRETIVAPSSTIDIAINDRGTGVLDRKINLAKVGLARDFKQLSALGAPQVQIDSYLPDVDTDLFKTEGSNEQRAESDDDKRRKRIEELRRKRDAGTLER